MSLNESNTVEPMVLDPVPNMGGTSATEPIHEAPSLGSSLGGDLRPTTWNHTPRIQVLGNLASRWWNHDCARHCSGSIQKSPSSLTELFEDAKGKNTHIIVERIVADIDEIVKKVRFLDWQHTTQGDRLVQKELRCTLLKYKLHNDRTFSTALTLTSGSITESLARP